MYNTFNKNVTNWLNIVANAAPSTPMFRPQSNIKIGSKIMFKIAPDTIDIIEYLGDPSALITEFNIVPTIINGIPSAITLPYEIAYSLNASVHPNKLSNCGKNIRIDAHNITDTIAPTTIPLPTPFSASFFFFSPNLKLKYADVPSPNISENARHITTIGNTMFVAPFPKYPTPQPINIWSTILYNAFTTIDIIHGIANALNNLLIFSVPKSNCFILLLMLVFTTSIASLLMIKITPSLGCYLKFIIQLIPLFLELHKQLR